MALEIKHYDKAGYLAVKVSGQWELASAKQAIEAIRAEANRREYSRVFVDLSSFAPPGSDMTRFFTGEQIWTRLRIM